MATKFINKLTGKVHRATVLTKYINNAGNSSAATANVNNFDTVELIGSVGSMDVFIATADDTQYLYVGTKGTEFD